MISRPFNCIAVLKIIVMNMDSIFTASFGWIGALVSFGNRDTSYQMIVVYFQAGFVFVSGLYRESLIHLDVIVMNFNLSVAACFITVTAASI